jgi:hypothetical protein
MTVRSHAGWMEQLDDRILELLDSEGSRTAAKIRERLMADGEDMEYTQVDVDVRCSILADAGLLEQDDVSRAFEITPLGREYLDGAFDASRLTDALTTDLRENGSGPLDRID